MSFGKKTLSSAKELKTIYGLTAIAMLLALRIVLGIFAFFGIIVTVEWWTVLLTGLFGIPGVFIGILITMFI